MREYDEEGPLILVVDDEPDLLESVARILEGERMRTVTTNDPEEVMSLVASCRPDAILSDFRMPRKNGLDLLKELVARHPGLPVIMLSAYATGDGLVEAVRQGAFDYLLKPFSIDALLVTVRRALEYSCLRRENERLSVTARADRLRHTFCGSHPDFVQSVALVCKVASSCANVLICGERGVGKELAAQTIHHYGVRAHGPYRMVNCATLAEAPFDDEAGRSATWDGLFEVMEGGTIYLARLEALSLPLQAKLLARMMKSRPAPAAKGGAPTGVRVVASTSPGPEGAVAAGLLSDQLFRVIDVVRILLPPLRGRAEDIGALCDLFLRQIGMKEGGEPLSLDPGTAPWLMEYDWPGNVRELKNAVEYAASRCAGRILTLDQFPPEIRHQGGVASLSYKDAKKRWLDRFEKRYLEELLYECNGNISKASGRAGVARMSLYRMMRRVGVDHEGVRQPDASPHPKPNADEENRESL